MIFDEIPENAEEVRAMPNKQNTGFPKAHISKEHRDSAMTQSLGKRGVTLVELVIVMAVIAIVSTMLVSMCVALSRTVSDTKKQVDTDLELSRTRTFFEYYFSHFDSEEYEVDLSVGTVEDEGQILSAFKGTDGKTYAVCIKDEKIGDTENTRRRLVADYGDGNPRAIDIEYVNSIFVSEYNKAAYGTSNPTSRGKRIYKVDVRYSGERSYDIYTYTFLIVQHSVKTN